MFRWEESLWLGQQLVTKWNPEGNWPRCTLEDNIKMDTNERRRDGVERINLAQDTDRW
jgi:hypothetical protein